MTTQMMERMKQFHLWHLSRVEKKNILPFPYMLFLFQQPKPRQTSTNQRSIFGLWRFFLGGGPRLNPLAQQESTPNQPTTRPPINVRRSTLFVQPSMVDHRANHQKQSKKMWVFLGEYHPKYIPPCTEDNIKPCFVSRKSNKSTLFDMYLYIYIYKPVNWVHLIFTQCKLKYVFTQYTLMWLRYELYILPFYRTMRKNIIYISTKFTGARFL